MKNKLIELGMSPEAVNRLNDEVAAWVYYNHQHLGQQGMEELNKLAMELNHNGERPITMEDIHHFEFAADAEGIHAAGSGRTITASLPEALIERLLGEVDKIGLEAVIENIKQKLKEHPGAEILERSLAFLQGKHDAAICSCQIKTAMAERRRIRRAVLDGDVWIEAFGAKSCKKKPKKKVSKKKAKKKKKANSLLGLFKISVRDNTIIIDDKEVDRKSAKVEGIDLGDYPKFCDAFFTEAKFTDGTPLSEEQIERLTNSLAGQQLLNEVCTEEAVTSYPEDRD